MGRRGELTGNEDVVGDGVGGEVAEISQGKGLQRWALGAIQDGVADLPVVAVPRVMDVTLPQRDVGRQVSV
jgi:hypothetical protein